MFGDNKSVADSSMMPHVKLHKCHMALSFHRVREAMEICGLLFLAVRLPLTGTWLLPVPGMYEGLNGTGVQ